MGMFDDLIPEGSKGGGPPTAGGMFDDLIPAPPSVAEDVAKSAAIGVPKGVMGLAALPGEASNLIGRGVNALGNWLTGKNMTAEEFAAKRAEALGSVDIAGPTGETVRKGVESVTGPLYEPKTKAGEYAQTVGEFVPAAMAGPGGIVRRAITGAVIPGVTSEAAGQLTKDTAAEPYARMAGAVAPGALAAGAKGMLVSPRGGATRAGQVANLEAEGVTDISAGARTGSRPLQYLEQSLGDVTGAGTRMTERGQEQLTRAFLRRAGEDAPRATEAVVDKMFDRIGTQFDRLAANNTLMPDKNLLPQIQKVVAEYDLITSATNKTPAVRAYQNEITNAVYLNKQGIPGDVYQSLRSRIEATARKMPPGDPATFAIRDMKGALDSAMEKHLERIGSPDLGAWRKARDQYRNALVIERAATAGGEGAAAGLLSPAAVGTAVKTIYGRRAFGRGLTDMGPLARSAEGVMKPLPQSGTAPRHYMTTALPAGLGMMGTGVMTGNPALMAAGAASVLGPPVIGRTLMSRPVQNWLGTRRPYNYTPAISGLFDMQ
jgi:hypothetical protein